MSNAPRGPSRRISSGGFAKIRPPSPGGRSAVVGIGVLVAIVVPPRGPGKARKISVTAVIFAAIVRAGVEGGESPGGMSKARRMLARPAGRMEMRPASGKFARRSTNSHFFPAGDIYISTAKYSARWSRGNEVLLECFMHEPLFPRFCFRHASRGGARKEWKFECFFYLFFFRLDVSSVSASRINLFIREVRFKCRIARSLHCPTTMRRSVSTVFPFEHQSSLAMLYSADFRVR